MILYNNRMKYFLSLIIACTLVVQANAQKVSVAFGAELKAKEGLRNIDIIAADDQGTYTTYYYGLFDIEGNLQEEVPLRMPEGLSKDKAKIIEFKKFGKRFVMLCYSFDKAPETITKKAYKSAYLTGFDLKGTQISKPFEVDRIVYEKDLSDAEWKLTFSPNNEFMMLQRHSLNKKTEDVSMFTKTYNASFKTLSKFYFEPGYTTTECTIHQTLLNNVGIPYFLASIANPVRPNEKTWKLMFMNLAASRPNEMDIKYSGMTVFNPYIATAGDGLKVYCAGYYAQKPMFGYDGMFTMILDPESLTIANLSNIAFDKKFAEVFSDSRAKVDSGFGFNNLYVNHIIPKTKGGFFVFGEGRVTERKQTDVNNRDAFEESIKYEHIIGASVAADGTFEWLGYQPRKQSIVVKSATAQDKGLNYTGYSVKVVNDSPFIFYSDLNTNFPTPKINDMTVFKNDDYKNSVPVYASFDGKKGKASRFVLYGPKTTDGYFKPNLFAAGTNPTQAVIAVGENDVLKIGKVVMGK
jgi:hypothetical protein